MWKIIGAASEFIAAGPLSEGRFLNDNSQHSQWQPLWYCGTRYDYLYPPALRYGTACLSRVFIMAKAYHPNTALPPTMPLRHYAHECD
jgi:hypothetical protein